MSTSVQLLTVGQSSKVKRLLQSDALITDSRTEALTQKASSTAKAPPALALQIHCTSRLLPTEPTLQNTQPYVHNTMGRLMQVLCGKVLGGVLCQIGSLMWRSYVDEPGYLSLGT